MINYSLSPTKAHIFNVLFLSYLIWITIQMSVSMALSFFAGANDSALEVAPSGGAIFLILVIFLWGGYVTFYLAYKENWKKRFEFTAYWMAALTFPAIILAVVGIGLSAQTMWLAFFTSVLIGLVRNIYEGMGFLIFCLASSLVALFYYEYISLYSIVNITPPMCPPGELLPFFVDVNSSSADIRCWEGPHFYRISAVFIGPFIVGMAIIYLSLIHI